MGSSLPSEGHRSDASVDVFLHIPKTGGSTLRTLLYEEYEGALLKVSYRKEGRTLPQLVGDLRSITPEQWNGHRLVFGHVGFGIHREIPRPVTYFTLVRHPVDRLMSQYLHSRRTADAAHHDAAVSYSLVECLRRGLVPRWINPLVWTLSEAQWQMEMGERGDEPCDEASLAEATRNLDAFAVVGLTERYDMSVAAMRSVLGWQQATYTTSNVGETPAWRRDPELRRELASLVELDLRLYETATQRFEQQWAENEAAFEDAMATTRWRQRRHMWWVTAERKWRAVRMVASADGRRRKARRAARPAA